MSISGKTAKTCSVRQDFLPHVYKILLRHVIEYLKKKGADDRIAYLQNTLLIDQTFYDSILEQSKDTKDLRDR